MNVKSITHLLAHIHWILVSLAIQIREKIINFQQLTNYNEFNFLNNFFNIIKNQIL